MLYIPVFMELFSSQKVEEMDSQKATPIVQQFNMAGRRSQPQQNEHLYEASRFLFMFSVSSLLQFQS